MGPGQESTLWYWALISTAQYGWLYKFLKVNLNQLLSSGELHGPPHTYKELMMLHDGKRKVFRGTIETCNATCIVSLIQVHVFVCISVLF